MKSSQSLSEPFAAAKPAPLTLKSLTPSSPQSSKTTMKTETPSWLADPESGTLTSPTKIPTDPPPNAPPPPTGITREPQDPDHHLGWWILFMRVFNMATMILLGVAAVFAMTLTVEVDSIILGVYGILFASLVFCFETQLWFIRKRISSSFGFLFNPIFRTLFYGIMAAVAWSYDSTMGKVRIERTSSFIEDVLGDDIFKVFVEI
ncbi:hypothetical protein TrLO_g3174 [Triparma laevis f. longispina]|uniref:Uncharacterized protein n=1 Tax=Triparma laevis f. longispina TaxID=1714387 RepID=A0A9W7CE27_9STRA|nr:hypothetical protein TrLO_g3174 [Triparma laevis f. longispina]